MRNGKNQERTEVRAYECTQRMRNGECEMRNDTSLARWDARQNAECEVRNVE
jgi:hypothetical protein